MSQTEEVKNEEEVIDEGKEEVKEVVMSPVEQSAREQGWVSEEEWVAEGKDASEWRSAKEFVDRGELYRSIHSTKRELKQTQAALTALQKHHAHVFEKAQKQALEELKREKRLAIREEDFQKLEQVEEQIEELTEQQKAEKQAFEQEQAQLHANQGGTPPEFEAWQSRNTWYVSDEELREYADFKGIKYAQKNPGISPSAVLEYVEKQVRKQFPDKFGTQKKAAPNPVTGVNKTNSASRKGEADIELTDTERDIMNDLVSSGVMTKAQYIAELKKVKDR